MMKGKAKVKRSDVTGAMRQQQLFGGIEEKKNFRIF
jgi:hypothetical protein